MISSQIENLKGGHRWYVVVTHAGQERLAAMNLRRQDFEAYLPMRPPLTANPRAGAKPLFPRYMFVSLDMARPGWRALYSTIGVHDVLSTGSGEHRRPKAIPGAWVERIQAREVDGLVILKDREPEKACGLTKGDKVTLPVGHKFGELEAVFEERVDARRVALLISLLGRDSRVVVDLGSLK